MKSGQQFIVWGAILAGLAVVLGAFGAHGLKAVLTVERLAVFETAVRYQFYHALAIIIVGLLADHLSGKYIRACAWLFIAGIVLFSGSLYLLILTGLTWLGAVTPLGGISFIAGWAMLAIAAYNK